jgi:hypothetical protein
MSKTRCELIIEMKEFPWLYEHEVHAPKHKPIVYFNENDNTVKILFGKKLALNAKWLELDVFNQYINHCLYFEFEKRMS